MRSQRKQNAKVNTACATRRFPFFHRVFTCVVICFVALLSLLITAPAFAKPNYSNNPKYAAIVIDADTKQVLHEANPDAPRHPASLTKMMTLYLTFEALQQGRLSLRQQLTASRRAASMPKTNLNLREGDKITVEDAIKALVVRSANDVSVILAEELGKTEFQFAVAMTNKARRLGMQRTVFRNANGLPDVRQVTTARDMATLGLALRRDFPRYYPYFKTLSFTYKGRTYNTHNHVVTDYPGADGLKTGYINMSGFNLVTSVKRDGYSVVGVVMGGRTSRSRDDHMKDLLTRSLRQLASNRKPGDAAETRVVAAAAPKAPIPVFKPGTPQEMMAKLENETAPAQPQPRKPGNVADAGFAPAAGKLNSSVEQIAEGQWGIQVGAFVESRDAFMAAAHAMNLATRELQGSEITVTDPDGGKSKVFRARIANITEEQARRACRVLLAHKEACFVYRNDRNG